MDQSSKIIKELGVFVFLKDFSTNGEIKRLMQAVDNLNICLAKDILELIQQIKSTEKDFFIEPTLHPWAKKLPSYNFKVIDLSDECFRLVDWCEHLKKHFPEIEKGTIEKLIESYVYHRHLR